MTQNVFVGKDICFSQIQLICNILIITLFIPLFPILRLTEPAQSVALWVSQFDLCTSVIINGPTLATRYVYENQAGRLSL